MAFAGFEVRDLPTPRGPVRAVVGGSGPPVEDYRAGATVDVADDDADRAAGRQIACAVLMLWAAGGGLPRFYGDVLGVWRPWAPDVRGAPVDASHFMAEDRPQEIVDALAGFFSG